MRVLHLFSNRKWTGPAEPVVNLCVTLLKNNLKVVFACSPKRGTAPNKIVDVARENGIEPLDFMHLSKHRHPLWNRLDVRALRRHLSTVPYDLIHCHLDNDHEIALEAAARKIPIIRTNHFGAGLPVDRRHRILATGSAALVEPSHMALEADHANFLTPRERLFIAPGAVDTKRFDPERVLPDMRERFNIPRGAFVLGIVARMQPHRHYEELFAAFHKLTEKAPDAHLVVVGRGTRQEQVGFKPVQELGLAHRVHFTGYLDGDSYAGTLNMFTVGLFLTPGTDGACRAVREIMAMGKPMIVADRGMLREIVAHNKEGIVTDGSVEELYDAFLRFYHQRELREHFAENARKTARTRYTLEHQSECVIAAYEETLRTRHAHT
ncbi:MAG TPA: glycosyltransferase [Candidatus Hydrogenedentes bacterium]|nr:glycosyltransferase [Candidatus Hydrogenedentota bacterium]